MNFDQKAKEYEKISISQKQAADYLYQMLDICPNDKIIDVGCGTGYLTEKIYAKAQDTSGIDISEKMINEAKLLRPNVNFSVMDAESMSEKSMYNWIITNAVTYYFNDLKATIKKFNSALNAGGKYALQAQTQVTPQFLIAMQNLLADCTTKEHFTEFKLDINHLTIDEFLLLLIDCGFSIEKAEMITYKSEYTLDEAFDIFKSGTATPFLNPKFYKKPLTDEYIKNFFRIVYDGLRSQLVNDKINLGVPRCFIVARKAS